MIYPDYSSDDGFSDDNDYENYKERIKKIQAPPALSDKEQQIKRISIALSSGNLDKLVEELDKGFDVNSEVEPGWTLLALSVFYGKLNLVKELVKRGADIHNTSKDGNNLLILACCLQETNDSLEIIKILIENGINVKYVNRRRMNALMFAASKGNLEAVKFLLPLSDVKAQDNQRWTALFWAVSGNHIKIVEYLLEHDFDCTITDLRGNNVVDLAKYYEFLEIYDLFGGDKQDEITQIIRQCENNNKLSQFKRSSIPKLQMDIFGILEALKSECTIKQVYENNLNLLEFLSVNDEKLQQIGVKLPFQRNRILNGLYRFHKQPFNPKSLHIVQKDEIYSNMDVAVQLISALKQIIVMEASLKFIRNNIKEPIEEFKDIEMNLKNIQRKIQLVKIVSKQLNHKINKWDKIAKPADLINSKSHKYLIPWRKILFFSSISLIIFVKLVR